MTGKTDIEYIETLDWRMNVFVMVMTYFQSVSIKMQSGIEWPESIIINFSWFSKFFDMDFVEMVAPECVFKLPYSTKYVLKLLVPLLILGYLDMVPRFAVRTVFRKMGKDILKSCEVVGIDEHDEEYAEFRDKNLRTFNADWRRARRDAKKMLSSSARVLESEESKSARARLHGSERGSGKGSNKDDIAHHREIDEGRDLVRAKIVDRV
jgi:hypothetical protein